MGCPVSATASASETLVSYAALEPVIPLPPGAVVVTVLNATDRRGLAAQVTSTLQGQGFTRATTGGNDLLHPPGTMRCRGQIRFGSHGAAAARTLALVMPCAELVSDERQDSTVDLVLGATFSTLDPNSAARTVLKQLDASGTSQTEPAALQSIAGSTPAMIPDVLLAEAHQAEC
jgi:hypothetical protein